MYRPRHAGTDELLGTDRPAPSTPSPTRTRFISVKAPPICARGQPPGLPNSSKASAPARRGDGRRTRQAGRRRRQPSPSHSSTVPVIPCPVRLPKLRRQDQPHPSATPGPPTIANIRGRPPAQPQSRVPTAQRVPHTFCRPRLRLIQLAPRAAPSTARTELRSCPSEGANAIVASRATVAEGLGRLLVPAPQHPGREAQERDGGKRDGV